MRARGSSPEPSVDLSGRVDGFSLPRRALHRKGSCGAPFPRAPWSRAFASNVVPDAGGSSTSAVAMIGGSCTARDFATVMPGDAIYAGSGRATRAPKRVAWIIATACASTVRDGVLHDR